MAWLVLEMFFIGSLLIIMTLQRIAAEDSEVTADAKQPPAGLMGRFGHKVEIHKITTQDGYILELDRIPGPKGTNTTEKGPPVLVVHGIAMNAGAWVTNYPSESPGFLLADAGFDVWLINDRGAPESNFHKTLSTNDPRFWEWSFDEIGRYDLPAAVDHILNVTGFKKLGLIGFSQGFTVSVVFLSMREEYNDKVSLLVGYAAVANLTHFTSPVRLAVPFAEVITTLDDILFHGALLVSSPFQRNLIATVCNSPLRAVCYLPLGIVFGYNANQLNTTRIPVYVANIPVGTSSQNALHFTQVYRAKNLVRYDFGVIKNLRVYSQAKPPAYPLEKIRAPVALFRGLSDIATETRDYEDLKRRLQRVLVADHTVADPGFAHLDFVFGYKATDILHIPMINLMRNYTSTNP